ELTHFVNGANRRMIERRGRARLFQQLGSRILLTPAWLEQLDRNRAVQLRIERAIHHTHSAAAEQRVYPLLPQYSPDHERRRWEPESGSTLSCRCSGTVTFQTRSG